MVTIWEHEFDSNKGTKGIKLDEYDLVEQPKFREDGFLEADVSQSSYCIISKRKTKRVNT